MKRQQFVKRLGTAWCALAVLGSSWPAFGGPMDPFVIGARGGVVIWSEPQPDPDVSSRATKIVLTTLDPAAKIVTFEGIALTGDVVQIFDSFTSTPTPNPDTVADTVLFNGSWGVFDSHLLIAPSMVGGGAGGGFSGITESNNGLFGDGGLPPSSGSVEALAGLGQLTMAAPSDAFFLTTPFQGNELEFAYVVTPDESDNVFLILGVLGEGIVNSGQPGGASWGGGPNSGDPVHVLFRNPVPEPAGGHWVAAACLGVLALWRRGGRAGLP